MAQYSGPYAPRTGEPASEPSTTDVARDEAAGVGQHAREAGGQVAQTATDQARQVVAETGRQARDLLGEAQDRPVTRRPSSSSGPRSSFIHSLMSSVRWRPTVASPVWPPSSPARRPPAHGVASWLEQREPADLLDEVRNFARRRPTFLIGAAVAGLAVGRLTRGLKDQGNGQPSNGQPSNGLTGGRGTAPALPAANNVEPAGAPGSAYPTETYPPPRATPPNLPRRPGLPGWHRADRAD